MEEPGAKLREEFATGHGANQDAPAIPTILLGYLIRVARGPERSDPLIRGWS